MFPLFFPRQFFFSSVFFSLNLLGVLSADVSYQVRIEGVDQETTEILESVSLLKQQIDRHPPNLAALKMRAEDDMDELIKALHSLSYYDAELSYEIEDSVVVITIDLGETYPLKEFTILGVSDDEMESVALPEPLNELSIMNSDLRLDSPAKSADIIAATDRIIGQFPKHGYPLVVLKKRDVLVDQEAKEVRVILKINPGPLLNFGQTEIVGLKTIEESFIRKKIRWCEGETFSLKAVSKTEASLLESKLFTLVRITYEKELDENGAVPLKIELTESKHRAIAVGAGYTTQLHAGATAEWEHRNYRGRGEHLRLEAEVWSSRQKGIASYRKPDFLCVDQDLLWLAQFEKEDSKSYNMTTLRISALIDQRVNKRIRVLYGLSAEQLHSSQSHDEKSVSSRSTKDYTLIKTPFEIFWVSVDDLLTPRKGQSFHLDLKPTTHLSDNNLNFVKGIGTAIFYYPLDEKKKQVIAFKGTAGAIIGEGLSSIPDAERFYEATEHSLRGYKYKSISPLNPLGIPIGGRSLAAMSIELRSRFTETIGATIFYEAGNVFSSRWPDFEGGLLQSAGVGARYYTPLGPIRFDIAIPLNRRKGLDPNHQYYFSVGEAF
jgi:translocation and assembly module TamA